LPKSTIADEQLRLKLADKGKGKASPINTTFVPTNLTTKPAPTLTAAHKRAISKAIPRNEREEVGGKGRKGGWKAGKGGAGEASDATATSADAATTSVKNTAATVTKVASFVRRPTTRAQGLRLKDC
jgi:hypothetical protein